MNLYQFEPRDPLILRDGRSTENAMRTLKFPWPSTLAGMVRTKIGQNKDGCWNLTDAQTKELLNIPVQGPWLVEVTDAAKQNAFFFPTPLDAVWYGADGTEKNAYRLAPGSLEEGECTNLPDGLKMLCPRETLRKDKPDHAPGFISAAAMSKWLGESSTTVKLATKDYLNALQVETRTHVKIDGTKMAAEDGALFSAEGLCFAVREESRNRRFALGFGVDRSDNQFDERLGVAFFGGEKRFGFVQKLTNAKMPERKQLEAASQRLRMVLVTPGIFSSGYKPDDSIFNGDARIVAAATGRPQHISGWDYAAKGPKASRRMAPAGSVYWVELTEGIDPNAFAEKWWMQSLCDNKQDRRDGFGLCITGVN